MQKHHALLIFILLFQASLLHAQYYVSPNGHDENTGSFAQPFQSIQKAIGVLQAGDTCYIRSGVYRESITIDKSGTEGKPIVIQAYQDEKVQIKGTETVSQWKVHAQNIYKAYFPQQVSQLWVNDSLAFRARFPDKDQHQRFSLDDWAGIMADSNGSMKFWKHHFPKNYWKGAQCIILTGQQWVTQIGTVVQSDSHQVTCTNRSHQWYPSGQKNYLGHGHAYLINHMHALDHENEWHWQNDTIYYYTEKDIHELQIEARTKLYGFILDDQAYVQLNNLDLFMASIRLNNSSYCSIDHVMVRYPTPFFHFKNSFERFNKNKDYSIDHWDGCGVIITGHHNLIQNSYIAHSWGDGISLGGVRNTIKNCIIEDCNWMAIHAAPIGMIGKEHQVLHNTLRETGRGGLVNNDVGRCKILYNNIYNYGYLTRDLGATHTYKTDGENTEIAYNWVHDRTSIRMAEGIYIDNYCSNFLIHHNVVWHTETAIRVNKPAKNIYIYHNTLWFNCYVQKTSGGFKLSNNQYIEVFNNLSSHPMTIGSFIQANLSMARPGFTNARAFNFSLKENSEAIDKGIIVQDFIKTYVGQAPDAGAYEYGMPVWKAGANWEVK
jgi:hypothetical protein